MTWQNRKIAKDFPQKQKQKTFDVNYQTLVVRVYCQPTMIWSSSSEEKVIKSVPFCVACLCHIDWSNHCHSTKKMSTRCCAPKQDRTKQFVRQANDSQQLGSFSIKPNTDQICAINTPCVTSLHIRWWWECFFFWCISVHWNWINSIFLILGDPHTRRAAILSLPVDTRWPQCLSLLRIVQIHRRANHNPSLDWWFNYRF